MGTQKPPKRLRIKSHCSIDGIRIGKRLRPGLYILNQNMTEEEALQLSTTKFAHCVEALTDAPQPEPLATDADVLQATDAYKYAKEKEIKAAEAKIAEAKQGK